MSQALFNRQLLTRMQVPPAIRHHYASDRPCHGTVQSTRRHYSRPIASNEPREKWLRGGTMHRWIVLSALVLAVASHSVKATAQDAVHVIAEFTFESGEKLVAMKVGYATHGRLNAAKSNAILVTHGASGLRTSNAPLIGP